MTMDDEDENLPRRRQSDEEKTLAIKKDNAGVKSSSPSSETVTTAMGSEASLPPKSEAVMDLCGDSRDEMERRDSDDDESCSVVYSSCSEDEIAEDDSDNDVDEEEEKPDKKQPKSNDFASILETPKAPEPQLWTLWKLVDRVSALCAKYPSELVQPIARHDMIFMATRLLAKQQEFVLASTSETMSSIVCPFVDLGYHYTNSVNLESIRQEGLMSRPERDGSGVKSDRFNGAAYGEGIYTGNNRFDFSNYGDTGLFVARLVGTTKAQKWFSSSLSLLVLPTRDQCLPLIRFPKQDNSNSLLDQVQHDLGIIIDEFFNETVDMHAHGDAYRCVNKDGQMAGPLSTTFVPRPRSRRPPAGNSSTVTGNSKPTPTLDPNYDPSEPPKRPKSAFYHFCITERPKIQADDPTASFVSTYILLCTCTPYSVDHDCNKMLYVYLTFSFFWLFCRVRFPCCWTTGGCSWILRNWIRGNNLRIKTTHGTSLNWPLIDNILARKVLPRREGSE